MAIVEAAVIDSPQWREIQQFLTCSMVHSFLLLQAIFQLMCFMETRCLAYTKEVI